MIVDTMSTTCQGFLIPKTSGFLENFFLLECLETENNGAIIQCYTEMLHMILLSWFCGRRMTCRKVASPVSCKSKFRIRDEIESCSSGPESTKVTVSSIFVIKLSSATIIDLLHIYCLLITSPQPQIGFLRVPLNKMSIYNILMI